MAIIEWSEVPENAECCECGCDQEFIDLIPTEDGDWICAECFSWKEFG